MPRRNNRYSQMASYATYALLAAILFFVIYLFAAGSGVIWLKVLSAIIAILICILCLAHLYLTKELLRPRSLWMSTCAVCITVCILFSLILNFPSPSPPVFEDSIISTETS